MTYAVVKIVLSNPMVLDEFALRILAEEASPDGAESEIVSQDIVQAALPRIRGYLAVAAVLARPLALQYDADKEEEGVVPYDAFLDILVKMAQKDYDHDIGSYFQALVYAVELTAGFAPYQEMMPGVKEEESTRAMDIIGQAASYLHKQLTAEDYSHRRVA